MLRINLLPPYVQQRRLTKKLIPAFVAVFAVCVALPLAGYFYLHSKLVKLTQDANAAVSGKAVTDSLKAEAVTTIAQVGPIQQKLQFVTDVDAYARRWVARYAQLADTTPRSSFIYSGAAITGPTMAIKAYSPSVETVGRYLQVMYHEPDFSTVAVDHIPAYPDNLRHLYYLNGVLVFADGASASSGTGSSSGSYPGAGGGRPGAGGYPGGSGGSQGGQAGAGAPANFTPEALGPNGATNIPPDVGPPPPEIAVGGTGGATGQQASGGYPGGGSQAGGGQTGTYSPAFLRVAGRGISPFASPAIREQIYQKALRRVVVKTVPKGFDINVTATLKEPLTPPVPPGSAPAGGTSPGGYPGSSPGAYPGTGGTPGAYPGTGGPGGPGRPGGPGGRSA